jgi:hypothetical protein
MGVESSVVLGIEATLFLLRRMGLVSNTEYWHLEHTMEHQL